MVDIDSETLFNGAAAIVATIAVVFFVLNAEFSYSPVSKFGLVIAFLAGIFFITQRTSDYQLTLLGYGVIVTSGVALFFDVVNTFSVGNALTVVGLLCIAAVLFSLRTLLDGDSQFVTGTQARYAFAAVSVLVAVVVLVDVATGSLAYELQPESEVEYGGSDRGQIRVASTIVTNPTPLPERVRTPEYDACTVGDWSTYRRESPEGEPQREVRADVHVQDGYNEYVFGYGSKTYPVELYLDGTNLQGETFPVRTTEGCPDGETGSPYIALFEADDDEPYARPV